MQLLCIMHVPLFMYISNSLVVFLQRSNDGREFKVPVKVARMSKMLSETIPENDDDIEDKDLYCPKVNGDVLEKVVEYCLHYQEEEMNPIEFKSNEQKLQEVVTQKWYLNFIKQFDRDSLFPLIAACNFMHIEPLLNLSVLAMCVIINNKSEDEIRKIFNLPKAEKKFGGD